MAFTRSTTAILVASIFAASAAHAATHSDHYQALELPITPKKTLVFNHGYGDFDLAEMVGTHGVKDRFIVQLRISDNADENTGVISLTSNQLNWKGKSLEIQGPGVPSEKLATTMNVTGSSIELEEGIRVVGLIKHAPEGTTETDPAKLLTNEIKTTFDLVIDGNSKINSDVKSVYYSNPGNSKDLLNNN